MVGRILRGLSRILVESLLATAGSTFRAHAGLLALPGARGDPCRMMVNEWIMIAWSARRGPSCRAGGLTQRRIGLIARRATAHLETTGLGRILRAVNHFAIGINPVAPVVGKRVADFGVGLKIESVGLQPVSPTNFLGDCRGDL